MYEKQIEKLERYQIDVHKICVNIIGNFVGEQIDDKSLREKTYELLASKTRPVKNIVNGLAVHLGRYIGRWEQEAGMSISTLVTDMWDEPVEEDVTVFVSAWVLACHNKKVTGLKKAYKDQFKKARKANGGELWLRAQMELIEFKKAAYMLAEIAKKLK